MITNILKYGNEALPQREHKVGAVAGITTVVIGMLTGGAAFLAHTYLNLGVIGASVVGGTGALVVTGGAVTTFVSFYKGRKVPLLQENGVVSEIGLKSEASIANSSSDGVHVEVVPQDIQLLIDEEQLKELEKTYQEDRSWLNARMGSDLDALPPIAQAIASGSPKLVEKFLEWGAKPKYQTTKGEQNILRNATLYASGFPDDEDYQRIFEMVFKTYPHFLLEKKDKKTPLEEALETGEEMAKKDFQKFLKKHASLIKNRLGDSEKKELEWITSLNNPENGHSHKTT